MLVCKNIKSEKNRSIQGTEQDKMKQEDTYQFMM